MVDFVELAQQIWNEGRRGLSLGLDRYTSGDLTASVLYAALGVEHLAKGFLASVNPALVAEARHARSLLWFALAETPDLPPPTWVRTIGFSAATDLLTQLVPGWNKQVGEELFRCRNRCAHFGGLLDDSEARAALRSAFAAVDLLLPLSPVREASVFGRHDGLVAALRVERSSGIDDQLAALFAAARANEPRVGSAQKGSISKALESLLEVQRDAPHDQVVDCPVCGLPALVCGELVFLSWRSTYESKGLEDVADGHFEGHRFDCGTCGLSMNRSDLVEASGVLENWRLSESDRQLWEELQRGEDELMADWSRFD